MNFYISTISPEQITQEKCDLLSISSWEGNVAAFYALLLCKNSQLVNFVYNTKNKKWQNLYSSISVESYLTDCFSYQHYALFRTLCISRTTLYSYKIVAYTIGNTDRIEATNDILPDKEYDIAAVFPYKPLATGCSVNGGTSVAYYAFASVELNVVACFVQANGYKCITTIPSLAATIEITSLKIACTYDEKAYIMTTAKSRLYMIECSLIQKYNILNCLQNNLVEDRAKDYIAHCTFENNIIYLMKKLSGSITFELILYTSTGKKNSITIPGDAIGNILDNWQMFCTKGFVRLVRYNDLYQKLYVVSLSQDQLGTLQEYVGSSTASNSVIPIIPLYAYEDNIFYVTNLTPDSGNKIAAVFNDYTIYSQDNLDNKENFQSVLGQSFVLHDTNIQAALEHNSRILEQELYSINCDQNSFDLCDESAYVWLAIRMLNKQKSITLTDSKWFFEALGTNKIWLTLVDKESLGFFSNPGKTGIQVYTSYKLAVETLITQLGYGIGLYIQNFHPCSTYTALSDTPSVCFVNWASGIALSYCARNALGCYLPYEQTHIYIRSPHIFSNTEAITCLNKVLKFTLPTEDQLTKQKSLIGGDRMIEKVLIKLKNMHNMLSEIEQKKRGLNIIELMGFRGGSDCELLTGAGTVAGVNTPVTIALCYPAILSFITRCEANSIDDRENFWGVLFHELTHALIGTVDQAIYGAERCRQWSSSVVELLDSGSNADDIPLVADCVMIAVQNTQILPSGSRRMMIEEENSIEQINKEDSMKNLSNNILCSINSYITQTGQILLDYSLHNKEQNEIRISSLATMSFGAPGDGFTMVGPTRVICNMWHSPAIIKEEILPALYLHNVTLELDSICAINNLIPGLYTLTYNHIHHVHIDNTLDQDVTMCFNTNCSFTHLLCSTEILITKPSGLLNVAVDESL